MWATLIFLVYSDSVALEDSEDKGEIPVLREAKLVEEVIKDAETGPQQTEDKKEKQEEEASVAKENEEKGDTSATPKSEIIFSSSTVEEKLIQKDTEENVEEVHETLDEYVSLIHSVFPTILLVWKADGQKAFGHQNQLLLRQINDEMRLCSIVSIVLQLLQLVLYYNNVIDQHPENQIYSTEREIFTYNMWTTDVKELKNHDRASLDSGRLALQWIIIIWDVVL